MVRVISAAPARRPGDRAVTVRSQRQQAGVFVTARTVPEPGTLADNLGSAADNLPIAVTAASGTCAWNWGINCALSKAMTSAPAAEPGER